MHETDIYKQNCPWPTLCWVVLDCGCWRALSLKQTSNQINAARMIHPKVKSQDMTWWKWKFLQQGTSWLLSLVKLDNCVLAGLSVTVSKSWYPFGARLSNIIHYLPNNFQFSEYNNMKVLKGLIRLHQPKPSSNSNCNVTNKARASSRFFYGCTFNILGWIGSHTSQR